MLPMRKKRGQPVRIITWNSEGDKRGSLTNLLNTEPDVLVVQECGDLMPNVGFQEVETADWITSSKVKTNYKITFIPWARKLHGNYRVSMAVIYKATDFHFGSVTWCNDDLKRPIIAVNDDARGIRIYNIHAGGRKYIKEALAIASRTERSWVVVGDFNQDADYMRHHEEDFIGEHKHYNVVSTEEPDYTRRARIIDYAISNLDGDAELTVTTTKSDHNPVEIVLNLR